MAEESKSYHSYNNANEVFQGLEQISLGDKEDTGQLNGDGNFVCMGEDMFAIDDVEDFSKVDFLSLTLDVMNKYHFGILSAAYDIYNEYDGLIWFSIRKHKGGLNNEGDIHWQTFICYRHGHRDKRYANMPNSKIGSFL